MLRRVGHTLPWMRVRMGSWAQTCKKPPSASLNWSTRTERDASTPEVSLHLSVVALHVLHASSLFIVALHLLAASLHNLGVVFASPCVTFECLVSLRSLLCVSF